MGYLSNAGLSYFFGKLKTIFAPISHGHGGATQSAAGFMSAADKKKLDGIAEGANKYSLPTATSSVLGGVKTGANITNNSGVLSVTADNVKDALGYTPPEQDTNTWRPVVNNLTSDSTTDSLSAAQGKTLKTLVDGKAAMGHTHTWDSVTGKPSTFMPSSHTHGVIKSLSVNGTTITCTKDDGTTSTITTKDTNTTYGTFKGATTSEAGSTGLVIAPVAGNANRYLRSDGTWAVPPDTNTTYGVFAKATADAAGSTGLVPAPAKGQQTYYLRGDGTWAVPANTWRRIQDNLTSSSTTDSLSANQGKVLKGLIDGKAASGHTHNYAGSSSAGGAATSANKVNAALTINLNGTSQGAWDGSSAKSISITAASVGATSVTISRW